MSADLVVAPLVEKLSNGLSFVGCGRALSIQRNLVGAHCLFCATVSSFPLVVNRYIECHSQKRSDWQTDLEVACLTGYKVIYNRVDDDEIYYDSYRLIPYIFLFLAGINLLPSVLWKCLDEGKVSQAASEKRHSKRMERMMEVLKDESALKKFFQVKALGTVLCLAVIVYQVHLCNSLLNGALWALASGYAIGVSSLRKEELRQSAFPQEVVCNVTKFSQNESEKEFYCFLTMNAIYSGHQNVPKVQFSAFVNV